MIGRRLFSLCSALALTIASRASAQTGTGTLSGRVTSTDGQPLQGASVSIANSQRGAITRADGSYQVTLPAGRHELRVRQLGYSAVRDFVDITSGGTTGDQYVKLKLVLPEPPDAELETLVAEWAPKHPYDPRAGMRSVP